MVLGVSLGVAGIGGAVALALVRRHHSRTWMRPWFILAAIFGPMLLAGLPLLSGAIASRYLWGSHFADVAMVASTRLMALAAAAVWLVFEFLAAEHQHEIELYAQQHSSDARSRLLRRLAALLGAIALLAFLQGVAVAVVTR